MVWSVLLEQSATEPHCVYHRVPKSSALAAADERRRLIARPVVVVAEFNNN